MRDDTFSLCVFGDVCLTYANLINLKDCVYEAQTFIKTTDYSIANLECVLKNDEAGIIAKTGPNLRSPEDSVLFFKELGVNAVTMANNHTGDYGYEGIINTLKVLNNASLDHVGAGKSIHDAHQVLHIVHNNIKISIISICENEFGVATNYSGGVAGYDVSKLYNTINNEKKNSDHIIVIFHGGNEHNPLPSPQTIKRYHFIADLGATAVIGMHTHCPQGFEFYNNTFIAYSLGNFFFPGNYFPYLYGSWNDGYGVKLTFTKEEIVFTEIIPHRYDYKENKIRILQGEDKNFFVSYLSKISNIIEDDREIEYFYQSWCKHRASVYMNFLNWASASDDIKNQLFLEIQNLFRCESHRELMQTSFELLTENKACIYETYWLRLQNLFFIPRRNKDSVWENLYYIDSQKDLNIISSQGPIVIYGAGKVANSLLETILKYNENTDVGIMVTDLSNNPLFLQNIKIYSVKENHYNKDATIIIGVTIKYSYEILKLLLDYNYKNIAILTYNYASELISFPK